VTALVGDDPEAGHDKAGGKAVQAPDSEPCNIVECWMRVGDVGRRNERVGEVCEPVNAVDEGKVPDTAGDGWSAKISLQAPNKALTRRRQNATRSVLCSVHCSTC